MTSAIAIIVIIVVQRNLKKSNSWIFIEPIHSIIPVSNIKEVIELSIISQKLNGNIDVLSAKAE
jgi:hypothetical protein